MSKYTLGVSAYVGLTDYTHEENIKYLKLAASLGVKSVFTSAHIDEAKIDGELKELIDLTKELDMKIIVDISKRVIDKFNVSDQIYALRLDYGFTDEEIVEMSKTYKCMIELNASALNKQSLNRLIEKGLNLNNVRISHNFYPKELTGQDIYSVYEKNSYYKSLGLTVMAYIPSSVGKRPPIYEGLPTVEDHRYMNLSDAINELKVALCDEIFFGDAYCSEAELIEATKLMNEEISITMHCYDKLSAEELDLLNKPQRSRIDQSGYMIRSSLGRGTQILKKDNSIIERKKYDITIDNIGFKRYVGELGIMLKDAKSDERVNVVGHVTSSKFVVDNLVPGTKFVIKQED